MAGRIISLLISIGLIIGGLSGQLVLRGTNSSGALVIFGFLWLIYDIYKIATYEKTPRNPLLEKQINQAQQKSRQLTEPAEIVIANTSSDKELYIFIFNNNEFVSGVAPGKSITVTTSKSVNAIGASYEKHDPISAAFILEISEGETKHINFRNNQFSFKEGEENTQLKAEDIQPETDNNLHKNRIITLLLVIFLGAYGVHDLYLQRFWRFAIRLAASIGLAVIAGLLSISSMFALIPLLGWWIFDIIQIARAKQITTKKNIIILEK